jgi:cob(I)alamin adenosyltransferase
MAANDDEEVAALNSGIGKAAAVKREMRMQEYMKRIDAKLDEILARMGNTEVKQSKRVN